jgi:hypothetical protein
MKKIFISQPMRGKSKGEILTERAALERLAKEKFGEDCVILDTYFADFDGNALAFLGKSISKLSEADAAVFGTGWREARGCVIEHKCCGEYGVEIAELER